MTRYGNNAIDYARQQSVSPSRNWHNLCQMFMRTCFDVGPRYPTAEIAYNNANGHHRTWPPPRAVPVWWTNGRNGHVAISAGNGWCYSTDFKHYGRVDKVRINSITDGWGLHYRGWTDDINEIKVYVPGALPKIDVSNAAAATKKEAKIPQGTRLKKAVAAEVGKGEMDLSTAVLGDGFREQYKLVQRKYLRKRGIKDPQESSIDGIPGMLSMSWLGNRQKFEVKK